MEKQEDNERFYFEDFCETADKLALSKGSLCTQRKSIEKLSIKERFDWIDLKTKMINEQIIKLDRLDYFINRSNISKLYEIFKRDGNLANEEELNKLEQVMILIKEYKQIKLMYLETLLLEHQANKKKKPLAGSKAKDGDLQTLTISAVMGMLDECIHIVKHPTTIGDLTRMFTCHDWSEMQTPIYLRCQTNELKCMVDELPTLNRSLMYAKIGKCGLFITKKGKPIKAHCLTTSSCEKLKTRPIIQNIISEAYKKHGLH